MHKGSCLCGAVAYEISGDIKQIIYCHCQRCRKANGSAFNAVSPIPAAQFKIVKGQDTLKAHVYEAGVDRMFCSDCGSPIFSKRKAMPDMVRVRIGTLDTPIDKKVSTHIFVGSKAEWYDICDNAQQFIERAG